MMNMRHMFSGAKVVCQSISGWGVTEATITKEMFVGLFWKSAC